MSKPETQTNDLATKIAKKLLSDYAIGYFSHFMDEPASFDSVDEAELAAEIREIITSAGR